MSESGDRNATYIYFNQAGKFKDKARGYFPNAAFAGYYRGAEAAREECLRLHKGYMPGMLTTGSTWTVVVIPDDGLDVGWPILLPAVNPG